MRKAMKRIAIDFNTLDSEPVDLVKIAEVGSERERELPALTDGERVVLWEPGLEVEAVIVLYEGRYWMAQPDRSTWRDLALSSQDDTSFERVA
jgi:hypothetical protein